MAETPLRFVTMVGSLREGSYNAAVARALADLAPEGVEIEALGSVGDLPLYNQDVQKSDGFPAAAEEMARAIRAADGVIFVTPEYNYSVPGVLKNAIDWLSRMEDQPFANKPCAIQSASMGNLGGVRAQMHLRQILVFLNAVAFNKPEIFVGAAQNKIEDGVLTDAPTREFIGKQLAAFAEFARQVAA